METLLENFHFLRPLWFYAAIPAVLLYLFVRYRHSRASNWEHAIDPTLLPYLLDAPTGGNQRRPYFLLLLGWLIAVTALAGPVWEKRPQPVHEREDALVILLDLSLSMYATDVKPNRMVAARRKLLDLLDTRDEGTTALIVYAGDAHTVSPLTDDANTIAAMLPAITPEIMPEPGSRLARGLAQAERLFVDAGVASGRILIITDEIRDVAEASALAGEFHTQYPVSVMSVGTAEGAPIPLGQVFSDAGYLKDRNGVIVIPTVNFSVMQDFALLAGGRFSQMTLDDTDFNYLLAEQPLVDLDAMRVLERDFDVWFEEGPWLVLLLLPIAALSFRRGWLWVVVLLMMTPSEDASALEWADLWKTRPQQATEAFEGGQHQRAAELFEDPEWKGSAYYRAEDYEAAAELFANPEKADEHYNYGNALARLGDLEGAIKAYEDTLEQEPEHEDAAFNKQLLEALLEQQQTQQQQQQQQGESQDSSENQDSQQQQSQQQGDQQQDQQQQQSDNSEQQAEQEQSEQQQTEQQESEQGEDKEASDEQIAQQQQGEMNAEEQQALKQWLRRVPDDPAGLLRRKFEEQAKTRRQQTVRRPNQGGDW